MSQNKTGREIRCCERMWGSARRKPNTWVTTGWITDKSGITTSKSVRKANVTGKGLAKAESSNQASVNKPKANSSTVGKTKDRDWEQAEITFLSWKMSQKGMRDSLAADKCDLGVHIQKVSTITSRCVWWERIKANFCPDIHPHESQLARLDENKGKFWVVLSWFHTERSGGATSAEGDIKRSI